MRRRVLMIVLLAVVLLPAVAAVAAWAIIDPDAWRPEIAAAARRASGRDVALNGPVTLAPSLWPTVTASDVVLTGRGQRITIARVQARLALLPLLSRRIEVTRLTLIRPTLTLVPFVPPQTVSSPASPASPAHAPAPSPALFVAQLRIEDGQVVRGPGAVLAITRLDAVAKSAASPVAVDADLAWNGMAFQARGEVGSLAQLRHRDPASPWPVRLALTSADGHGSVVGEVADPLHRRGYRLKLDASLADTAVLRDVLPEALPTLHDVTLAATVADQGGRLPTVSDLAMTAGALDLGRLKLDTFSVTAPESGGPARLQAAGTLDGVKAVVAASLDGALAQVGRGPAGFTATVTLGTATVSLKGTVAEPKALAGIEAVLSARIPDLAVLAPIARATLPDWHDIALDSRVSTSDQGIATGLALQDFRLSGPQAAMSGEVVLSRGARPRLQAKLAAAHMDLDALLATPPPSPPTPTPPEPMTTKPAERRTRLIPDTTLPFAVLRRLDATVAIQVAELKTGGATLHDLSGLLSLQDGRLRVDPVAGRLPGGLLEAALHVDAQQEPAPVSLMLHAPGLAIGPLLAAFGFPGSSRGALEVDADLHSAGDTPRALAAGLDGHLGLAMVDGATDNRLLEAAGAPLLRAAKLPVDLGDGRQGSSKLRCLALRLDAAAGEVAVKTLLLDMKALRAEGTGGVDLRDEALDLRLKPLLRLAGSGIMVPLHIGGTLLAPRVQVDAPDAAGQVIGNGLEGAKGGVFSAILGALTTEPAAAQACGEQLVLARGGRAGPMPADPPPGAEKKPSKPVDLLRQLFR